MQSKLCSLLLYHGLFHRHNPLLPRCLLRHRKIRRRSNGNGHPPPRNDDQRYPLHVSSSHYFTLLSPFASHPSILPLLFSPFPFHTSPILYHHPPFFPLFSSPSPLLVKINIHHRHNSLRPLRHPRNLRPRPLCPHQFLRSRAHDQFRRFRPLWRRSQCRDGRARGRVFDWNCGRCWN